MRLKTGDAVSKTIIFTQADFDEFARLSGDDNPIHVDPAFSARTKFRRTVAHGMFLYGTICGLLSEYFPGAVQVSQDLMFPAPTFTGEMMTILAEVTATSASLNAGVIAQTNHIHLKTTITNPIGQLTCDGQTILEWKERWDTD